MLKVPTPNVQSDDTGSQVAQESNSGLSYASVGPAPAPNPQQSRDAQHEQSSAKQEITNGGTTLPNGSPSKRVKEPLFAEARRLSGSNTSSESGSISSEDQGPLVASVRANGEPESREQAELTESEEALIARHTDMIAPKAAVPELKSPVGGASDAGSSSSTLPAVSQGTDGSSTGQSRSNSSSTIHRDSSSSLGAADENRRNSGDSQGSDAQGNETGSPASRDRAKKVPVLGPMEPMEPMEPSSISSERKKLPPLSAGFPTVPGFPSGDPGANTVLPGSHDSNAKRVHNLPSLVENARNLAVDSGRGVNNQFGPGNTNFMADMYTQSSGDSPYLHGITSRNDRVGNPSTASRLSGWGYDDASVGSVASHAVSYASPSQRNRDPRFSYTYPHGMLSGPAGIAPENMDSIALRPHYNHMGPPQPPLMTMAPPPGVPYQPGHTAVPVVHQAPPPPPPHQHPRQPLPSAGYPVMISAQQVYSPRIPATHYVGNAPPDGLESVQQQQQHAQPPPPPQLHMMPMSREASAAPAPPSHEVHTSTPSWSSTARQQQHQQQHQQQQSFAPATSESRTYRCTHPGCEWSFVRSSDQKRHIRSHEKPSLQCPYWEIHSNCNRKGGLFYRLDVLKRHLRLVHLIRPANGADDGGSCRVCGRVFEHTRDFISHCTGCAEDAKEKMLAASSQNEAS